jgi:hypothetical protein
MTGSVLGHTTVGCPRVEWVLPNPLAPQVPAPVRSGDCVRLRITIKSKRESSRPERGHFDLLYELLNQEGDVVLSVLMASLIERRPPER